MNILGRASQAVSGLLKVSNRVSFQTRLFNEEARNQVRALKPGDKLHGYTVQRVEEVPEYFITAAMLTHDKTGAQHLHAARDDANNTFSVAFRTTPMDSTGVPHILEHTVLCGSKNFPVRDPFFKMLNRSMATFMNAFTASDWTMYPFSSQNEQDFKNLLSIYMDASFFPLIRENDFCQEGWRLEHTNAKDASTPIIFKGVVYNEMKGVFSNSQSKYMTELLNALMPSHTYGVVSGGDPAHIPKLTYDQLKKFYSIHYHPSNARFFSYGNLPLNGHLEFIDSKLKEFEKIEVKTQVPKEKRWSSSRSKSITCVPDPMAADPDKQTTVSVSYLLNDVKDSYESFVCNVMCYLLTNGETAPFYRALLESNIGSDYAPMTGYNGDTREGSFTVGLLNIKKDDVDDVLEIIEDTVDKVIKEGFEKTRIDALLHTIELGQKHESSNLGLRFAMGIASSWNHDGDPIEKLQDSKLVEMFRAELKKNPKMLQERVQKYLKDNHHKLALTMSPDPAEAEKRDKEEAKRLDEMVSALSEQDREHILARGAELEDKQNEVEDLSCLPSLKVDDLDRNIQTERVEVTQADWSFIQTCEQPTNGVSYIRMASNLEGLPDDLLPYVPLFCQVITSIGAGGHDYLWVSQKQELYTGGMSASPIIVPHHTKSGRVQRAVVFSSYCLEKNFNRMMELWSHIINSPDYTDTERLYTLIRMCASDLASSMSDIGHNYAMVSSASTLDTASHLQEVFGGYSQVRHMKSIAELADLTDVIFKLQSIGNQVLDKTSIRTSINATPDAMDRSVKGVKTFLSQIKGEVDMAPIFPELDQKKPVSHQTHYELPFGVNFMAQSFPAVPYSHKDFTSLAVLAKLMSRKFLHREIREKGGAYGSGAQMNAGVFSFFSYRDPRNLETLDVFRQCIDWAGNGQFFQEDVDEAKLGVFQTIDKPVTPANRGQTKFLRDINDDMRQTNRDRLFAVNADHLRHVTEKYLNPSRHSGTAYLGPPNEKVQADDKWTVVREDGSQDKQAKADSL